MRNFFLKLFVFISLVIFVLCLPSYVLWQSKENFYKIDKLITGNEKYLIGYAYNQYNYRYLKWGYLNSNEKKKIWALGASRVLQLRDKMFDASFYNAGFTISSLNDFRPFLKSIPRTKYPEYLIIGLDQTMFNSAFDSLKSAPSENLWKRSFRLYPKPILYQLVSQDFFAGKYSFSSLQKPDSIHKIGLDAIINNAGFRNDGSIFYGSQIVKLINNDESADDYHYSNTLDRIREGNRGFEPGKAVNEKALVELNEVLKFCKENQIEVIGFLPPFANKVYKAMSESGNYPYLNDIYNCIKPVFEKYKYEVYDFSKISSCNSNDSETIDGMHGGELTYQKLLIRMLESGSILNKVTNMERLKMDLNKNKNNYIVYDF